MRSNKIKNTKVLGKKTFLHLCFKDQPCVVGRILKMVSGFLSSSFSNTNLDTIVKGLFRWNEGY